VGKIFFKEKNFWELGVGKRVSETSEFGVFWV